VSTERPREAPSLFDWKSSKILRNICHNARANRRQPKLPKDKSQITEHERISTSSHSTAGPHRLRYHRQPLPQHDEIKAIEVELNRRYQAGDKTAELKEFWPSSRRHIASGGRLESL
jgi:hypothetical protein